MVYGHPVLAMAINRRLTATFTATRDPTATEITVKANLPSDNNNVVLDASLDLATQQVSTAYDDPTFENERGLLEHIFKDILGIV